MKLHLPLALLAAIVCVSTPVAQARNYSNVSEFLRTEDNPNGIFEHSYDKDTGAVTIILHEGDFSTLDMYRSVIGSTQKQLEDDGTIMGAAPLTLGGTEKYVSSSYNDNKTDVVNSVSITVNGATKGTGSYDDYSHITDYKNEIIERHLNICGIGYASCHVQGTEKTDRINITVNSGDIDRLVGGASNPAGTNHTASGEHKLVAKYYGNISITVNGGKVKHLIGGHHGKEYDLIHTMIANEGCALPGSYTNDKGVLVENVLKDNHNQIINLDKEKYEAFMSGLDEKFWSIGGDINITVTGGEIGNIKGAGTKAHSADGDVNLLMTGGSVREDIVVGSTGAFAELGGNATAVIKGDARVLGNVYGTMYDTGDATSKEDIERGLPAPVIKGKSSILVGGNAVVEGNVCAAGDGGIVEGNTEVYLLDNAVVKGLVSGIGINGAALAKDSTATLYVGTESKAYTGSVGAIEGFTKLIVTKGSSLQMSAGNVFAANKQIITLSAANLQNAALIGTSAIVGNEGLELTLLADEPLSSGKYKIAELSSGKMRAATNNPDGWSEENVTVNGIAGINDTAWEGTTLYLTWKEQNVDAAIVSNWGAFKSSQAFTGTLWGNRSNAVVLDDKTAAPATVPNDGKAPVAAAEQPTPAAHATTLAWASAYGQSGRISNAGADYSLYGAAMGIERQFGATGSSIGVAFGYDWGKVSPFTTTAADQETWHAALYGRVGTWKAGKGIVSVDWSAAYGDTTTEHNDFASDWSQDSWQLDLRATYAQAISERATASVFAGVQYYTHDDAVVDNMHISSLQNLRLTAGAGLSYAATARTNVYGQASVYFDAMRHNPHVDANGACFKGTNPGRIGGILSVGADYSITDRWTLRGAYSFDVAKNSNEHNVNAGVQYSF
ncbi:MAG: autotransporter outer membrane beta-barrel domain-containing protein [Akkermansia sp.]|nr:autotransporter outer membrane beta-barrel domain-containing protein [Akkermansia sp.]